MIYTLNTLNGGCLIHLIQKYLDMAMGIILLTKNKSSYHKIVSFSSLNLAMLLVYQDVQLSPFEHSFHV